MVIKLGMVGGGVMGEAILSRLLATQLYQPQEVLVSEPQGDRRDYLRQQYQIQVTAHNQEAAQAQEAVLLAIKPQIIYQVAADLQPVLAQNQAVVLSILAGTTLQTLSLIFPDQPILRVMPNTPAVVGAGMSAIAPNSQVTPEQLGLAQRIFAAVGQVVEVNESLMDAVTGLSGSGPAFVALMVEALADGGVASGLPRAIASQLALQTVLGTAQLIQDSQIHPAQLKDKVTSPGGTTIAGVATLEAKGFRSAVIEAVRAAYHRSQELGQ